MRVKINIPNHAALIKCVLDGCIEAGRLEIESGAAPPGPTADTPIVEDPEGDEIFKLPHQTASEGGDCEDVCIWRCATLRATGEDPDAHCEMVQVGRRDLHCIVMRGDGSTEDPWSEIQDGTWSMGFSLSDLNPVKLVKAVGQGIGNVISAVGQHLPGGAGTRASSAVAPSKLLPPGVSQTSSPGGYNPALPPGYGPGPAGYPSGYPMSYPPPGQLGVPSYQTPAGYPYGGYPQQGYQQGYPQDPYAGIPFYEGDVDEDEDEDDDDDQPPPRRKPRVIDASSDETQSPDGAQQ
jgi:hypothetical protein